MKRITGCLIVAACIFLIPSVGLTEDPQIMQRTDDKGDFCGRSTFGQCASDSDCIRDGCSKQVCRSIKEGAVFTTCEWRDCYDPAKYNMRCKCAEGRCQWTK